MYGGMFDDHIVRFTISSNELRELCEAKSDACEKAAREAKPRESQLIGAPVFVGKREGLDDVLDRTEADMAGQRARWKAQEEQRALEECDQRIATLKAAAHVWRYLGAHLVGDVHAFTFVQIAHLVGPSLVPHGMIAQGSLLDVAAE